ncbi:MAG: heat-inducible transcriptional repressor HrcA [Deferrisomatales bacterium]|nr:heat-inducible transcriptional repressor HrcA [Deferrisomatales bacterium]
MRERDRQILSAVVEEFVQTAEPVGSRYLARKHRLGVSPATVRNAMADLEDLGYLAQPHTSAGRKPTDKGYRYYVDCLMSAETPPPGERRRLRRSLGAAGSADIQEILGSASRVLSSAARQVGIVAAPRFEAGVFWHIDFVLLREGRVLVILVSQSGVVHHRPVAAPEIGSQAELDRMANYLNSFLQDLTLREVKERIVAEMASEVALYDSMLRRALELGSLAVGGESTEGEVYFGDPAALFDQPEFSSASRMRGIFEAFEKKGLLIRLLDRAAEAPGLHLLIGEENPLADLRDCTLVAAPYRRSGRVLGSVGVIGPTRMDYPRVVGLVEYTARLVGEALDEL